MSQLTLTQMGWVTKASTSNQPIKQQQQQQVNSKQLKKEEEEQKQKEKEKEKTSTKLMYNFLGNNYQHLRLKQTIHEYGLRFTTNMTKFYVWKEDQITDEHIHLIKNLYLVSKKKAINTGTKIIPIEELLTNTVFVASPSYSEKVQAIITIIRKHISNKSNLPHISHILLKIKRHSSDEAVYKYLRNYYCWCQRRCNVFYYNKNSFLFLFLKSNK